jgi:hypothetical protein
MRKLCMCLQGKCSKWVNEKKIVAKTWNEVEFKRKIKFSEQNIGRKACKGPFLLFYDGHSYIPESNPDLRYNLTGTQQS